MADVNTGTPNPAAGGAPAAGTPNPAAGGTPAAFDWGTTGLDADTLGYVQTKGFKGVGDVVSSYRNFEKLQGVPADQIIKLPKPDDAAGWKGVWSRLGAPEKPEGYKLPVPEGDKGEFAKVAAGWFHELGVPAKMAEAIAAKWNTYTAETMTSRTEQTKAKFTQESEVLKKDWGQAFDQNVARAQLAAGKLGFDEATIDAMENAKGFAWTMKFFSDLGAKMGESGFDTGDNSQPNQFTGGMLTPAQAKAKIGMLQADREWSKKYVAGDATAKAEMENLHRLAYADE
jgi:hypothetical protein